MGGWALVKETILDYCIHLRCPSLKRLKGGDIHVLIHEGCYVCSLSIGGYELYLNHGADSESRCPVA